MSQLFHLTDFNFESLKLNPVIYKKNKLYLDFYINEKILSPLFFIEKLQVVKFTTKYILLDLRDNLFIKEFFLNLEKKIIIKIKESEIIKKYKLKNYSFITLVNSFTSINNETFDVLKLNIDIDNKDSKYSTSIFYRYGQPVIDLNIMSTSITVKTIFELISVVFDMDKQYILLENCCRQLKVKNLVSRVERVKDIPYSFIDSENSNQNSNDESNDITSVNEPLLSEFNIKKSSDNSESEKVNSEIDNDDGNDDDNDDNDNVDDNDDDNDNDNVDDDVNDNTNEEDNKIDNNEDELSDVLNLNDSETSEDND